MEAHQTPIIGMASGCASYVQSASTAAREGGTVIVKIGAKSTIYHVHRALLVKHSEYFTKALNGPWRESRKGEVVLDDVECWIFDIFVNWLYTASIPSGWAAWRHLLNDISKATVGHNMVSVCAFAHRIFASDFAKTIEYELSFHYSSDHEWVPDYATVIAAFSLLPGKSPVLRLLVDAQCAKFKESDDTESEIQQRAQLPQDFLIRVMLRYSKMLGVPGGRHLNPCNYHDHGSEALRRNCKL